MKRLDDNLRSKILALRTAGKTYGEIQAAVGQKIPKSTLSYVCKGIPLSSLQQQRINALINSNMSKARASALVANQIKREAYLSQLCDQNKHLILLIQDKDTARIALAMLYLAEGAKTRRGALCFGNSDPDIIRTFVGLLRKCYNIQEDKFRCTLQCRADQDVPKLEKLWSDTTLIPLTQFYKARIDPRTIGKPTKKPNYKGVCIIDYFSAEVYNDIKIAGRILTTGL